MVPVQRFIISEDTTAYAVDVWSRSGSIYIAQAQQLYVEEYRIGVANAENETTAVHKAVEALKEKY